MPITINGSGTITGASTLATPVASPTLTTPNINLAQFATVSGTAPIYPCRAWVNFNGTGTVAIRASGNVSSITDNGTSDYTVNFTSALPDTNYAIAGAARITTSAQSSVVGYYGAGIVSTTQVQIRSPQLGTSGAGYNDAETVTVVVFR